MKKLLAFVLAVVMLTGLCACGKQADDGNDGTTTTPSTTTTTASVAQGDEGDTTTEGDATVTEGDATTTEGDATTTEGDATVTEGDATTEGTQAPTKTDGTKAPSTTTKAPTKTAGKDSTTSRTQPNFIVTPPTSSTTVKTTRTTQTTQPGDGRPTIKILSIGHSFSVDAMKTYMWDLFDAAGYNATIGYLYYPGASLERQYHYVKNNSKSYERYSKNTNGSWKDQSNACVKDALYDEDWDIVTFQPSPDYGKGTMASKCEWGCNSNPENDYVHFNSLVTTVRNYLRSNDNPYGPNEDVEFYYHLTWAFASDCKLWSFTYSNYDQMTMYKDFINATKKYVLTNSRIKGVIPCITSIQNARSSFMGDTFNEPGNYDPNADGYHLNDKGDLVAAMTWVAYFTGKSAMDIDIGCKYSALEYDAICEAVDNAIKTPWSVTQSTYTEAP